MSHVTIPATGSGDATPQVATDFANSTHFQVVKIADGTVGGTAPATVDPNGNLHVLVGGASPGVFVGASVSNFPATQPVSGNVTASVIGYVGASISSLPVASVIGDTVNYGGSVTIASVVPMEIGASVANFPATQTVAGNVTASVVGYVGASIAGGTLTASAVGYVGASVTNFPATQAVSGNVTASVIGYVGASLSSLPVASVIGDAVNWGGSLTLASTNPGIYVGASVANFPATQPVSGNVTASVIGYVGASITNSISLSAIGASQVVVGGSITVASTVPGIFIGASISNVPAVAGAASQVVVGGSITIASVVPMEIGASVANFPATQTVAGNVTASVIGYVGASLAGFPVASVIGDAVNWGGSVTVASANPGVFVGASVSNFPATQPVSGNVTASVIGYVGASLSSLPVASVIGDTTVYGGSVTIASVVPMEIGASVANFPATQTVAGNVTASVIGYVGASTVPGFQGSISAVASVIGYVGASLVGGSVNSYGFGGSQYNLPAADRTNTLAGASPFSFISGASFNQVLIKNAAGNVYNVNAQNVNAAARYLRMFDKATTPSPGVDKPVHTYVIPGNANGTGFVVTHAVPILHANGIGFDITGGSMGASDTTATGLGDVVVNFGYS